MNNRMMREICRNASAMVDFQLFGKLPATSKTPPTPLRDFIETIPPALRSEFKGIKLSPSLGFNCGMTFDSLHQLYSWLGGNQTLIGNQTMPYMSWRNMHFNKKVTIDVLLQHTAKSPTEATLNRYKLIK